MTSDVRAASSSSPTSGGPRPSSSPRASRPGCCRRCRRVRPAARTRRHAAGRGRRRRGAATTDPGPSAALGLRAGLRARRRRHDPARGRARAGPACPLLGVNLGHVGFLAEAEREDLGETVERIVARDYAVEERMTLEVRAYAGRRTVFTPGRSTRSPSRRPRASGCSRCTVEIDGRPLSTLGLRRGRHGHADRLDGVRLLGRRPGRVARRRGDAARPDQRPRPVRPAAGGRPAAPASPSRCCAHRGRGRHVVRRSPRRRAAPGRAHRGARAPTCPCAWRG